MDMFFSIMETFFLWEIHRTLVDFPRRRDFANMFMQGQMTLHLFPLLPLLLLFNALCVIMPH